MSLVFIFLLATATSGSIILIEELYQDVTRGESVILTCKFNKSVNCAWEINGYQLSIPQDNYTYVDQKKNGKQTTNCSIQIHHANKNNQGRFVCSSEVTDKTGDSGNKTVITLYVRDPTVVEHPPNELVVGLGHDAFLSCRWNTKVDCKWKHNNVTVAGDKYRYNQRDSNCFLNIRNVTMDDEGMWECVDGQNEGATSQEMQLKIDPSVVELPPKELIVHLGQTVVFPCQWDTQVLCKWKHNNTIVAGDKYWYNERDSNCSLVIRGVGVEDEGTWECVDGQNESTTSQETQLRIENQPGPLIFGCSKDLLCSKGASEIPKDPDTATYCQSSDAYPPAVLNWNIQLLDSDIDISFPLKQQRNQQNPNGTYNSVLKLNQKDFDYLMDNFNFFNLICSSEHSLKTEKVLVIHFTQSMKSTTPKPSLRHFYLTTTEATNAPETMQDVAGGSSSGDTYLALFIIFFLITLGLSGFIAWDKVWRNKGTGGNSEPVTSTDGSKNTLDGTEMQTRQNGRDGPQQELSNETENLLNSNGTSTNEEK